MQLALTRAEILAFQDDIRERFLRAEIRHPIHLCDPNQLDYLLPIFEQIEPQDWLFTSYRGIYHWLLKGVPPQTLLAYILEHGTMGFCDKERRIVSSAIVGGCLPVAVGVAMGLDRQQKGGLSSADNSGVWCFVGDMAAQTGGFHEATKYAITHGLPVKWIIEDNGLSTNTPTLAVWGLRESGTIADFLVEANKVVALRQYRRNVPHVGAGAWVTFS